MKIQCLVIRDGGSHVELHGKNYHFAPQADGSHVAEVTDEAHQDRFLAIEGYKLYRGKAAIPEKKQEIIIPIADADASPVEREIVAAQYEAIFGKKPHSRMKAETIKAAIESGIA